MNITVVGAITAPDSALSAAANILVGAALDQAAAEPGAEDGAPDSGFREMMRSLITAAADEFHGDFESAIGALGQALNEAAADIRSGG